MQRLFTLLFVGLLLTTRDIDAQPPGSDPLPPRALMRIGTSKLRHGDRILCLAFSPAGDVLVAGGGNDPLRFWNPRTGDLIHTINEPWVQALAFSASGQTLAFGGNQRSVRLWNFKLAKETGRLDGHKTGIKALAISPDTTTIASGSQDGIIILWNMENKRQVVDLNAHTAEITALAFSPVDSNILASAGGDHAIRLWSVETNQAHRTIDAGCTVLAIAFAPDGKTLYSTGDDHLIRRWDVATGKNTGVFQGHTDTIDTLIVDGATLISGSQDRSIRFWDAATTAQRKVLPRSRGDCDALAMCRAGDGLLATAGINGAIRILEPQKGTEVHAAAEPRSPLFGLALSADHEKLASVANDGIVYTWDARSGKLRKQWDTQQVGDLVLGFAPDSQTLVTASNTAKLWHANTGAPIAQLDINPADPVQAVAFAPDGKTLALAHRGGQVALWRLGGKPAMIRTFTYQGSLHALAWSPDGKKLAAAGGATITLWDPYAEGLARTFNVKEGATTGFPMVRSLAFGPDSTTLAAGGWDAVIRVYDLNAKNPGDVKAHKRCEGHFSAVFALAFSPDGRSIVSGSFDRTVRLWEAFSGKQIVEFKGHFGEIHGAAFTKDGRSVYSAGSDAQVFRWDIPGLDPAGKFPVLTLGPGELDGAWSLLASAETARGHEMMWRCIASGKQAVPYLADKIFLLNPERVKKLFKDLDSPHYPTRIAAMKELADPKNGRWMEGRYDAAIANAMSLEYRRRVEGLKEKLDENKALPLAQERLRVRRFMLMCEQVGSPEAIAAMQKIADQGPEEDIRAEARASLLRLKR